MHVCTEAYPCLLSFKAQGFPQIERGGGGGGERCLAGCHVVARTLAYHPVCIWGSLVKFQGGGVVLMFDFFLCGSQTSLSPMFLEDRGRLYTCYHVPPFH